MTPATFPDSRLSATHLWAALGLSVIKWHSGPSSALPCRLARIAPLEAPRLRSGIGKYFRHLVCPEQQWQAPCGACAQVGRCTWPRMFPGSAFAAESLELPPWLLLGAAEGLYSVHMGLSPDAARCFWLSLESALGLLLNADHGSLQRGPAWLHASLMDPGQSQPCLTLPWSHAGVPQSPAPANLKVGDRIRFRVPLQLKAGDAKTLPAMGDWLRLGRNRIARLAAQRGLPIWHPEDPRWRHLNASAASAQWRWLEARRGSPWNPVPKHHFRLEGWMGEVEILTLPEEWVPWATLLPWVGVGSHVVFGCGTGQVLAASPPKPRASTPHLTWKSELVLEQS